MHSRSSPGCNVARRGSSIVLLLFACSPFLHPARGVAQIGPQDTLLQLSSWSYTASEGAGSIAVTITRSGRLDNTVSVTLATADGTAVAGSDYTSVSTTVVFPGGALPVTTRTVSIPIIDDTRGENREALLVRLSAPTGATFSGLPSAVLFIDNDDPPTVTPALSVGASPHPKQLRLSWTAVPGATSITSYHRTHPRFPFAVLGTYSGSYANHDISVHRYPWTAGPQYKVKACNAYGCVESNAAAVSSSGLDTIGYFKPFAPSAADMFGHALAISADGTTLAVGAPLEGVNDPLGAVFIFKRQQSGQWSEEARLKATRLDTQWFGRSVGLSANGDTLVVSATNDHSGAAGVNGDDPDTATPLAWSGAAYVFTRSGVHWSRQAYLKASNPDSSDYFGFSVAVSGDGDTVAVGARLEDSNATGVGGAQGDDSAQAAGAVYVFTRSGTEWSQQAYVKASNTDADDEFGWSVALSSDGATLAVGARKESSSATGVNGNQSNDDSREAGAAYVFTRAGVQWSQQAYIKASNTEPYNGRALGGFNAEDPAPDWFGWAVALSADGDTLAVGAPNESSSAGGTNADHDDNDAPYAGAVYVFTRSAGEWSHHTYVKAINSHHRDKFGSYVALSGDGAGLAVGAPDEDYFAVGVTQPPEGQPQIDLQSVGAVYWYRRSVNPRGWTFSKYLKAPNAESKDRFGSVAVNDDGSTIAVGAPGEDSLDGGINGYQFDNSGYIPDSQFAAGAVYLY